MFIVYAIATMLGVTLPTWIVLVWCVTTSQRGSRASQRLERKPMQPESLYGEIRPPVRAAMAGTKNLETPSYPAEREMPESWTPTKSRERDV